MPDVREGDLVFRFPSPGVGCLDRWAFYRNRFSNIQGTKAVDFVYALDDECWLVEVKDYRIHPRTKTLDLCDEIAFKVRDTLAILAGARRNATDDEKTVARLAFQCHRWRVALHLEESRRSRIQNDRRANVKNKLKRLLRAVDPHPVVSDMSSDRVPWRVTNA